MSEIHSHESPILSPTPRKINMIEFLSDFNEFDLLSESQVQHPMFPNYSLTVIPERSSNPIPNDISFLRSGSQEERYFLDKAAIQRSSTPAKHFYKFQQVFQDVQV